MKTLREPSSVALAVLVFFTWLLWWAAPSRATSTVPASRIPTQLGLWVGTAVPVEQRALEILETDDVTLMEYHLGQELPVWCSRVAGFGNRAAFHPPELCYVGSHFEVLERAAMPILINGRARRVMRLVISQGQQQFEAWYWFTAGERMTHNYYQQQVWLLGDAIRRKPMSGTLVRISTPMDELEQTHRRLLAFMTAWNASQEKGL